MAEITIRMWRFASIEGAVLDEAGDPMADVPVRLLQRGIGERRVVPGPMARTDDRGIFRFASLEPGRYLVAVQSSTTSMPATTADEYLSQLGDAAPLVRGDRAGAPHPSIAGFRIGNAILQPASTLAQDAPPPGADGRVDIYRTTFYPGSTALAQAETVALAAGEERAGINLTLALAATVSVSGVVGDGGNMLLRLVPIDVDDWIGDDTFDAASTTTDDDGAFTFLGVPPGQYLIEGHTNDSWVRAPVTVTNAPLASVSLTARPELRVTGRVRFSGAGPIPSLAQDPAAWLASLQRGGDSKPVVGVTSDGQFAVNNCSPGRYAFLTAVVSSQGTLWTAASITANGKNLLAQPFDLESDLTDVLITLTDRPAEIDGTVQAAAEPLDVVAFPADYQDASDKGVLGLRTTIVDANAGKFALRGLPAGNYLVAAIPHSEAGVWLLEAMPAIASQATPVALAERGRITVDLKPVVIR
jgi:protocatechuate 3,4-dioxygenase beta subunit